MPDLDRERHFPIGAIVEHHAPSAKRRSTTLLVRFAVALGIMASCAATQRTPSLSRGEQHRARMPSSTVTVAGRAYEIFTCRGVNQSRLTCPVGYARRFEGALVCKVDGRWSELTPRELCAHLPHGCTPYQPPKNDANRELPQQYPAALQRILPHIDRCELGRVALSREGSHSITAEESLHFVETLRAGLPKEHRRHVQVETTACCGAIGAQCPKLSLVEGLTLSAEQLALRVEQALDKVPHGVGVELNVVWHTAGLPRCTTEDPDCGPQLYGGGCLSEIDYAWGGPRVPLLSAPREPGNDCVHDGDCFGSELACLGCWGRFEGDITTHMACISPRGRDWDGAMCGCYNGRCTYFRQDGRAQGK